MSEGRTIGDMSLADANRNLQEDLDKMQTMQLATVHGAAFGRELVDLVMRYAGQQGLVAADIMVLGKPIAELILMVQGAFDAHGHTKREGSMAAMHYSLAIIQVAQIMAKRAEQEGVSTEFTEGAKPAPNSVPPNLMN